MSCTKECINKPVAIEPVHKIDSALNIVCAGNSLTYGYDLSDPSTQSFPAQLDTMLVNATILNAGINGISTEQMQSDFIPVLGKRNIVIAWEIGNDIFWNGRSAADAVDSFKVYCDKITASGFSVYVLTLPARNNYYMGYQMTPGGDDSTAYNSKINAANVLLRQMPNVIDIAADKRLSKYSDTYFLYDHVHISAAGYNVIAEMIKSKI